MIEYNENQVGVHHRSTKMGLPVKSTESFEREREREREREKREKSSIVSHHYHFLMRDLVSTYYFLIAERVSKLLAQVLISLVANRVMHGFNKNYLHVMYKV